MSTLKVILPISGHDFDPSEVAVPWKIIRAAGHEVEFATADGKRGYADPMMLSGEGLDPWGWIPGLKKIKLFGLLLRADKVSRSAYRELEQDSNFLNPKRYDQLEVDQYDGLLLPGGHAKSVKQYMEDKTLQNFVADFFDDVDSSGKHKPVAAVCHGVVVIARAVSRKTGKSALYGKKTTALTWALESSAWNLTRYFARFWDPNYYRTYMESPDEPVGYWSVESEIKRSLENDTDFLDVPKGIKDYRFKTSGIHRDRPDDKRPAWVVKDGNYLSARWPGDVHTLAADFTGLLFNRKNHWENVYESKSALNVSWFQEDPKLSLELIRSTNLTPDAAIIDVGGGASRLVDKLCAEGFTNITVLDLAAKALSISEQRLAEKACEVEWLVEDVTAFNPPHQYALWHDRAVFHFLTEKADRDKYVDVLKRALQPGGHLIIMAFAIGGPEKCSGLDIVQYDAEKIQSELGRDFELRESGEEKHITPAGGEQKFAYFHFTKK